jgi:hypothetical protein
MENEDNNKVDVPLKHSKDGEFYCVEFVGPGFENYPKFYSRKFRRAFAHAFRYYADELNKPLFSQFDD